MPIDIKPPVKNPGFVASGVKETTITETIDMSGGAAASFPLAAQLPAGAAVIGVALSVPNTISAATAVKIGFGRSTSAADPDKYYLTADLTAVELAKLFNGWGSLLSAAENLAIFACATDGSAAGTIGGGADDYVIASITYVEPLKIYP